MDGAQNLERLVGADEGMVVYQRRLIGSQLSLPIAR
jgi:hypothetical protein